MDSHNDVGNGMMEVEDPPLPPTNIISNAGIGLNMGRRDSFPPGNERRRIGLAENQPPIPPSGDVYSSLNQLSSNQFPSPPYQSNSVSQNPFPYMVPGSFPHTQMQPRPPTMMNFEQKGQQQSQFRGQSNTVFHEVDEPEPPRIVPDTLPGAFVEEKRMIDQCISCGDFLSQYDTERHDGDGAVIIRGPNCTINERIYKSIFFYESGSSEIDLRRQIKKLEEHTRTRKKKSNKEPTVLFPGEVVSPAFFSPMENSYRKREFRILRERTDGNGKILVLNVPTNHFPSFDWNGEFIITKFCRLYDQTRNIRIHRKFRKEAKVDSFLHYSWPCKDHYLISNGRFVKMNRHLCRLISLPSNTLFRNTNNDGGGNMLKSYEPLSSIKEEEGKKRRKKCLGRPDDRVFQLRMDNMNGNLRAANAPTPITSSTSKEFIVFFEDRKRNVIAFSFFFEYNSGNYLGGGEKKMKRKKKKTDDEEDGNNNNVVVLPPLQPLPSTKKNNNNAQQQQFQHLDHPHYPYNRIQYMYNPPSSNNNTSVPPPPRQQQQQHYQNTLLTEEKKKKKTVQNTLMSALTTNVTNARNNNNIQGEEGRRNEIFNDNKNKNNNNNNGESTTTGRRKKKRGDPFYINSSVSPSPSSSSSQDGDNTNKRRRRPRRTGSLDMILSSKPPPPQSSSTTTTNTFPLSLSYKYPSYIPSYNNLTNNNNEKKTRKHPPPPPRPPNIFSTTTTTTKTTKTQKKQQKKKKKKRSPPPPPPPFVLDPILKAMTAVVNITNNNNNDGKRIRNIDRMNVNVPSQPGQGQRRDEQMEFFLCRTFDFGVVDEEKFRTVFSPTFKKGLRLSEENNGIDFRQFPSIFEPLLDLSSIDRQRVIKKHSNLLRKPSDPSRKKKPRKKKEKKKKEDEEKITPLPPVPPPKEKPSSPPNEAGGKGGIEIGRANSQDKDSSDPKNNGVAIESPSNISSTGEKQQQQNEKVSSDQNNTKNNNKNTDNNEKENTINNNEEGSMLGKRKRTTSLEEEKKKSGLLLPKEDVTNPPKLKKRKLDNIDVSTLK